MSGTEREHGEGEEEEEGDAADVAAATAAAPPTPPGQRQSTVTTTSPPPPSSEAPTPPPRDDAARGPKTEAITVVPPTVQVAEPSERDRDERRQEIGLCFFVFCLK